MAPQPIPAAPGWYVEESDDNGPDYDPVIAWQPDTAILGEPTLLPYVSGGHNYPPILLTAEDFNVNNRRVVYLPNYDPATA
jgi:hypothetical protein